MALTPRVLRETGVAGGAAMAAVLRGLGAVDGAAPVTVKESRRLRGPTPATMIETVFVRTVRNA